MAEYFPLLDRAVSGLAEQTAEARRSIYDRARAALLGQLRRMDPPVPEDAIARESDALDEAVARIESRFAPPAAIPRPDPLPRAVPASARPEPDAAPPRRTASRPVPNSAAPPVVPPPRRERPHSTVSIGPPLGGEVKPGASGVARPALPPRGTRPVMALRPVVPPPAPAAPAPTQGLPAAGTLPGAGRATPMASAGGFAEALEAAGDAPKDLDGATAPDADLRGASPLARDPSVRDGSLRPPAPRPPQAGRIGWRGLSAAGLGLAAMVAIGAAAYEMRDRPEKVVAARPDAQAATEGGGQGKHVDRADGAAADAPDPAAADAGTGAAVPAPIPAGAGDAGPSIAVAQRAALLVDAPDDPQKVRTYVGTVVWRLDSVSPGQGQPLATAVKADIDIPDARLKVTMLMQRNDEPQLPASHTIEFHFLPQPGNNLGGVKQVNVPEMRRDDDAPTGDPLAGVPAAIKDDHFLVGLSRGGAEGQNLRLVTERDWFDMSLLFVSGKLGKLTFEKGVAGQHVVEDALKAWH